MAKLTLDDVSNISGAESTAISTINNNSAAIEAALENTLSRDGTTPNQMNADLDMNSNDIINANEISSARLKIANEYVQPVDLATSLKISSNLSDLGDLNIALQNLGLAAAINNSENVKVSDYTLLEADNGKIITFDSSSDLTLSLPSVSSLTHPFGFAVFNGNTGLLTVDANSSESINGNLSVKIQKDHYYKFWLSENGTEWRCSQVAAAPIFVNGRTELKKFFPSVYSKIYLFEKGRSGFFESYLTSSLSAAEQAAALADTNEGIYITSGSYTWKRSSFNGETFEVGWFHDWSTTDLLSAYTGLKAVLESLETRSIALQNTYASRVILNPDGDWTLSGQVVFGQGGIRMTSRGFTTLLYTGTNAAFIFRHQNYLDGQTLSHIYVDHMHFTRTSGADSTDMYLRFYLCRHTHVTHNKFENGTVHVQFDAAIEPCFVNNNIFWHNDSAKTNAHSLRIKVLPVNTGATFELIDSDDGQSYIKSGQVWVFSNEMRSNIGDVQSHIYVEDIDGMQCFQNHLLNGERQIEVKPVIRGTGAITNFKIRDNFLDGGSGTANNIYIHNLTGTALLVARMFIERNKCNDSSAINVHVKLPMNELWVEDNEFDLCSGTSFIRTEGGYAKGSISRNKMRLSASKSPSTCCIDIFMTSLNQFRSMIIRDNEFYEDESGATFPLRCILLTGNSTNTCDILIDGNNRDAGFANLVTDNSGANVTVTTGTNFSY